MLLDANDLRLFLAKQTANASQLMNVVDFKNALRLARERACIGGVRVVDGTLVVDDEVKKRERRKLPSQSCIQRACVDGGVVLVKCNDTFRITSQLESDIVIRYQDKKGRECSRPNF